MQTIAILDAGRYPADVPSSIPTYPAMMRAMMGAQFSYAEFDIQAGHYPPSAGAFDAILVTGSSSSAYDPDPWIAELRAWLIRLPAELPLIGICFGHQIMA